MEFLIFILGLGAIALAADIHEKYHERQMVKAKHFKETIYA
jgi:hypothetical protein